MARLPAAARGLILALLVLGVPALAVAAPADPAGPVVDYAQLILNAAPPLVTVKFVLKISASGQDRESDSETTGLMIDAKGLVLCSNTPLGGAARFARARLGAVTATPTDVKVLVGDDTEGVPARVVARDTDLDLIWLQIKKPADKPYAFFDLKTSAIPAPGQKLLGLRRMGKYFDRTPLVTQGYLSGITHQPRELLVPSPQMVGALGTPVFDARGVLVGMAVWVVSEEAESNQAAAQEGLGLILPAAEMAKATQRALEQAATRPDAAEPQPATKPAPTTQPGL